jgi:hypothetical protein
VIDSPSGSTITPGLLLLCLGALLPTAAFAAGTSEDKAVALERGLARFQAGDFAGAVPSLERARTIDPTDLEVALLLGIAYYRTERARLAEPLLEAAATSADSETRASARIFLGLIAGDHGELDAALAFLGEAAASSSGALAESGRTLLALTSPRRLSASVLVRSEFDSNVPLLPSTPAPGSTSCSDRADGDALVLASLSVRPVLRVGLTFEETASYRQQFHCLDYDLFWNTAGIRYVYLGHRARFELAYDFEVLTLGSALYALGHVAEGGYRYAVVGDLGLAAHYLFRYRDYPAAPFDAFTGPSHTMLVEASWGTPDRPLELDFAYVFVRESTKDPLPNDFAQGGCPAPPAPYTAFSATGQGARVHARTSFARRFSALLTAWVIRRVFDPDPCNPPRHDTQLYADLSLAVSLGRGLALVGGGSLLRNISTASDFDYLKATAHLGVAYGYVGP